MLVGMFGMAAHNPDLCICLHLSCPLIKDQSSRTAHTILSGDQIEKNEMGGACSTYGVRRGVYRV
jgi:hypothetical protein